MSEHTSDAVPRHQKSPELLAYRLREVFAAAAAAAPDNEGKRWMAEFDRLIESRPLEAMEFIAQVQAATEAGLRGERAPRVPVTANFAFSRWLEDFEAHLRAMPTGLMTVFALILLSPVPRTTHEAGR